MEPEKWERDRKETHRERATFWSVGLGRTRAKQQWHVLEPEMKVMSEKNLSDQYRILLNYLAFL